MPEALIDRLNQDIEDIFDLRTDAVVFAETYENDVLRIGPVMAHHKEKRAKRGSPSESVAYIKRVSPIFDRGTV